MTVKIAWKTLDNVQTKTFKEEKDAMQWIRSHCSDIVAINGIITCGQQLSHFEIMDYIKSDQ